MSASEKITVPSSETQNIMDCLRRIVRTLRLAGRTAEKTLGLSGAQVYVLQKLGEGGTLSLNELAERTLTHQSTVSAVASRLVEKGLVVRAASRDDARRIELSLSSTGKEFMGRVPQAPQENLVRAFEKLPQDQRIKLAEILSVVIVQAGLSDQPASMLFDDDESTNPGIRRPR